MENNKKIDSKEYWKLCLEEHKGKEANKSYFYASITDGNLNYIFKEYKIDLFCKNDVFIKNCKQKFDNKFEIDRIHFNEKYVKKQAEEIINMEIASDNQKRIKDNAFDIQINEIINNYDKYKNNTFYDNKKVLILPFIPKVLTDIGFRGNNLTFKVSKFCQMLEDHKSDIDILILEQLPGAIQNPLAILISDSKDDSIVMILSLRDKHKNNLVVPISLQNKHDDFDIFNSPLSETLDVSTLYGSKVVRDKITKKLKFEAKAVYALNVAFQNKGFIFINREPKLYSILKSKIPQISKYNDEDLLNFKEKNSKPFYRKK